MTEYRTRRRVREVLRDVLWRVTFHQRRHRVKGCVDSPCKGDEYTHGSCRDCGGLTCHRSGYTDGRSLRRRVGHLCWDCYRSTLYDRHESESDALLRRQRTELDWGAGLPDQFPGYTRSLVKDFIKSGESERLIALPQAQAGSFNFCVGTLGMASEAYAEVRGGEVWLRRLHEGQPISQ